MATRNAKTMLNQYLSVKLDGEEMYVENLPGIGPADQHIQVCRERLHLIRQAMPKGKWRMTIETQWKCGDETWYQVRDVEAEETVRHTA